MKKKYIAILCLIIFDFVCVVSTYERFDIAIKEMAMILTIQFLIFIFLGKSNEDKR